MCTSFKYWISACRTCYLTPTVLEYKLCDGCFHHKCFVLSIYNYKSIYYNMYVKNVGYVGDRFDWRNMMPGEVSLKWTHEVPLKVNCFIWRAKLDRLPTARALTRRGIQLMSALCPYCELEEEDTAHALFRCPLASKVWEYVGHWCNIPHLQFQNAEEMVKYVTQWGTCSKQRKTLTSICYGTVSGKLGVIGSLKNKEHRHPD